MTAPMHIHAFQQAMHPAALRSPRPQPQQDALAIQTLTERHLWQKPLGRFAGVAEGGWAWVSVADGVASSPCADLASRSFLDTLHHTGAVAGPANQLPGLVRRARQEWQSRTLRPRTLGAACTLASLWCAEGQVCAVNCGDSRIWRLRAQADGSVQWLQISRDHTLWQQMLDAGEVQPEDASTCASVYQGLAHCLVLGDGDDEQDDGNEDGRAPEAWLHIWQGACSPGDCYLLATDGLHDSLPAAQLQALWRSDRTAQDNLDALHAAYRQAGAPDDVSVVALCIAGPQ